MAEYPDKLVLRANELYFALEEEDYNSSHEEILILELPRWKRIIGRFSKEFSNKEAILDVGCGTGFVATVFCPYLAPKTKFICSDISQRMLKQCESNLKDKNFQCGLIYKMYDGAHLPFADNSIDILTLNSVLHHIPNTESFLKEADRVLKKGGYLLIGHEANKRFYKNKIVWTIYRILYALYHPSSVRNILQRRGLSVFGSSPAPKERDKVTEKINEALLSEGLISEKLSKFEIDKIIEIYSIRGFDMLDLSNKLQGFKLAYFETYNHLYWIFMEHYKNLFIRALNDILGFLYPKDGKTMFLIFKKQLNN